MNTYLLEIGLEELPAQVVLPSVKQLSEKIKATCESNKLPVDSIETYSTPRRLTVMVTGLPEKQDDQLLELKGPPAQMAKDAEGNWSKAAAGFAKKNQVDVEDLFIQDFKGKDFLFVRKEILGKATQEVIGESAAEWIQSLNFPKNMRWGSYKLRYARPIRWLVSLWNDQVLPISLEMVNADRQLNGHRFLSSGTLTLEHAKDYVTSMDSLKVQVDYEKRKASIVSQIQALEKEHGFQVVMDEKLLSEVCNLVEWPTAILGSYEKEFLDLPEDVLVTTMAKHQRYFPVYDQNGTILSHFITIRNGDSHSADVVVQGNEKVIRARFSDAKFFFLDDQKRELSFFNERAARVVFFQKRGSVAQRVERIVTVSQSIAELLNLTDEQKNNVKRVAELSKFDLQTQMVNEFPSLQGVMGECYANLKGENALVSRGIREHYYPRHAQDQIASDMEIVVVALADRLDMLATAFSLNIIPSGSADPYALRRMAQGVVQLLLAANLPFSIKTLGQLAFSTLDQQQELQLEVPVLLEKLEQFFELRQRFFMQEAGIRYDVIDALLSGEKLTPIQHVELAEQLKPHLESNGLKLASEAITRAGNISKKQAQLVPESLNESALVIEEEKQLWEAVQPLVNAELKVSEYPTTLFAMEPAITAFFDKVMVMDEDQTKKQNRLFLCHSIAQWSQAYLDLGQLVFSK